MIESVREQVQRMEPKDVFKMRLQLSCSTRPLRITTLPILSGGRGGGARGTQIWDRLVTEFHKILTRLSIMFSGDGEGHREGHGDKTETKTETEM